jgi:glutamate--cysteine ligase catalytic subunit
MAHLFIRDPVSLFEEKLEQDLETETDHFENIQSTNWQSMRFKPPPPDSTIGWRVEFRPMELQLTDFENAAFAVFVVLLTRTILSFGLNFLIPISKSTENMLTAQKRDAATKGLFYFRKTVTPPESDTEDETDGPCQDTCCHDDEYCLMDANMIINGKNGFPGLIPLMRMYLNSINIDMDTRCTIRQYLSLLSQRASGELMTTAAWTRRFITEHPAYQKDSVVSEQICYDLVSTMDDISSGRTTCKELTGSLKSKAARVLEKHPKQYTADSQKPYSP